MDVIIHQTPDALVHDGRIETGFFDTPFRKVNLLEAHNFGGPLARPLRWLRLKEWVGFGLCHPRLFGGILVQDAKLAASGTVYLYDRHRRRLYEWLILDIPGRVQLPETLWKGQTRCGFGRRELRFDHDLQHSRHGVRVRIPASRGMPALAVDLTLHQDLSTVDPLVVSLPIPPDHHTYTHKSPLHLEGTIRIGGQEYVFEPNRDLGNLDEQKTFYPYRSCWHWGCFVARSVQGTEVMLNFVDQMTPKDQPGEDAMWVDGKLMLLRRPDIYPSERPGEFRIEDPDGRIQLRFLREGAKVERRNYGPLSIDYEQAFGRYDGIVHDDRGRTHRIQGAFGAFERMKARF
jgi:hypothetical protein